MDDNVLFTLEGDSSGATGALEEINGALEQLDAQLGAVGASTGELDPLETSLAGISEALGGLDGMLSGFADALGALTTQAQAAADQLAQLGGSADAASGQIDTMGTSAAGASTNLDTLAASATAAADANAAAGGNTERLGKQFTALQAPLLVAGAALAGVGIGAVVVGTQYESSMSVVQALTGQTAAQMDQFNSQIMAMSGQIGATPKALADGLYYVLSAGVPASQAMGVLKVATEGAAASMTDAKTYSDALTSALNSYGAGANQAAHYSDLLLVAVRDGKTTMSELASTVGRAASIGSAAGVSFDQVAAAMSTMTLSGMSARLASMDLSNLMTTLDLKTDALAKRAKKLGVAFDEQKFKTLDLNGQLQYLQQATGGSETKLNALLNNAPSFLAATKLMSGGGQAFTKILGDMKISSGLTASAFAIHEQTMGAAFDHIKASGEAALIALSKALEPVVIAMSQRVIPALQHFGAWVTTHGPQAARIFGVVAAAIGGALVAGLAAAAVAFVAVNIAAIAVVGAFALLAAGIAIVVMNWGKIVAFFQSTSGPALAVKAVLVLLTGALLGLATSALVSAIPAIMASVIAFGAQAVAAGAAAIATLAAAAPFILVGIAIAAVVATIYLLVTHWSQVQAFFGHLGAMIGQFFSGLGTRVHAGVDAALAWVAHLGAQAQALVRAGFALVQTIIRDDLNAIVGLFLWLFNHNYYFHDLVIGIQREFTWLHNAALAVWHAITAGLAAVWGIIKTTAEYDWRAVQRFIIQPVEAVYARLHALGVQIGATLRAAWGVVSSDVRAAWDRFVSVITGTAGRAGSAAHSVGDAILAPVRNLGSVLFSAGQHLMQMLINGIKNMAGAVGNAAQGVAKNIASFLGFHSPTEQGPGADADKWMPALGDMLATSLHAQVSKVARGANALAQAVAASMQGIGAGSPLNAASTVPSLAGGVGVGAASAGGLGAGIGGGFGLSGGGMGQFAQLIAQAIQQSRQPALGASPLPASLGSITQNLGGVTVNGVQNITQLYAQLAALGGLALEDGNRGAIAGSAF